MEHFREGHTRDASGRFIVPLPTKADAPPLGDSRSHAVRRFKSLECLLRAKSHFGQFTVVLKECLEMGHAEAVPETELNKASTNVLYLPMHAVWKESRTTTKLRVVFDSCMKSNSGASLDNRLLVGSIVNESVINVLLRFRQHEVAVTSDMSKMY